MRSRKLIWSSASGVEFSKFEMLCVWAVALVGVSLLVSRGAGGQNAARTSWHHRAQIDHNHLGGQQAQKPNHHHHNHRHNHNHHHNHNHNHHRHRHQGHHQQHQRALWLDQRDDQSERPHEDQYSNQSKFKTKASRRQQDKHKHELDGRPEALAGEYRSRLARLSKRQALDEAIHELRILESQDGQLRAFADSARSLADRRNRLEPAAGDMDNARGQIGQRLGRDFHCHLELMTNERPEEQQKHQQQQQQQQQQSDDNNFCLRNGRLAAQIPPFMLNLYRQLSFDVQRAPHLNFSETVQMMPYKAEIMRSFRQPKLASGDYDDEPAGFWLSSGDSELDEAKVQAEDSQQAGQVQDKRHAGHTLEAPFEDGQQLDRLLIGEAEKIGNVVVELSVLNGRDDKRHQEQGGLGHATRTWPPRQPMPEASKRTPASPACDLKQRRLPAHQRDEICFWFELDDELPNLISRDDSPRTADARELLVEAELHVFKLFPQVTHTNAANQRDNFSGSSRIGLDAKTAQTNHNKRRQTDGSSHEQQFVPTNRTTAGNLYHLRTNLLEVSLYQVLPRKVASNAAGQLEQGEFPLRLLDIRRIDLNSNGWETFYVKRAVEDWLREPRLNLGLVIKAKSMFDEPIQLGLIRFADAYDRADQTTPETGAKQVATSRTVSMETSRQARNNFNLSHQPLLVIYTTRLGELTTHDSNERPPRSG